MHLVEGIELVLLYVWREVREDCCVRESCVLAACLLALLFSDLQCLAFVRLYRSSDLVQDVEYADLNALCITVDVGVEHVALRVVDQIADLM